MKTGAEQTTTVATQRDAFDQLFNEVLDNDSDGSIDDTMAASDEELNRNG